MYNFKAIKNIDSIYTKHKNIYFVCAKIYRVRVHDKYKYKIKSLENSKDDISLDD